MATVVTINRPQIVALNETAGNSAPLSRSRSSTPWL